MQNLPRHFTASAVVIVRNHILLIHHHRIGAWLPPGGHIEAMEMPHEGAVREVEEETGLKVRLLAEPIVDTKSEQAFFLPMPLSFHSVRATEKGEQLFHLDLVYLCAPADKDDQLYFTPPVSPLDLPPLCSGFDVKESSWVDLNLIRQWNLAANVLEIIDISRLALQNKLANNCGSQSDREISSGKTF